MLDVAVGATVESEPARSTAHVISASRAAAAARDLPVDLND
jgi:hypothetical protein